MTDPSDAADPAGDPGAGAHESDDLPARDDPYWDELTRETARFVRELRADERRRRLGSNAYTAYVVLVVVVMYVVPYVWYALTRPVSGTPDRTAPGWAIGAVGLAVLVLVAFLRDGAWRGPAVVDRPTAAWLLPSPTHRRALLLPRWRTALVVGALAGAAIGGLAGVVARVVAGGAAGAVAAAGAGGALLLAAGGTAVSAVAETGRPALRRPALLWIVPAVLLALAVASERVAPPQRIADYLPGDPYPVWTVLAAVLLWSGPWGWLVQPFVAALPGRAPGGVDALWPVGLGLGLVGATVLVVLADRLVPTIDGRTLRGRADSVALVGASILAIQPRRARLTVLAAQGHAPSTRWRLPVPKRRWLLGVWRDASALLRAPARVVWSVLWLVLALVLLAQALRPTLGAVVFDPADGTPTGPDRAERGVRLLLGVPGFVALYLAVAQLAEPARLDADDVRRLRIRPTAATRQALGHAVVPVLVVGALLLVARAVVWAVWGLQPFGGSTSFGWFSSAPAAAGGPLGDGLFTADPMAGLAWSAGIGAAVLALPLLTGAALVSAYRGEVPLSLLATGGASPMGDPGPGALLAWYARAPLVSLLLLLPALLGWSIATSAAFVGAAGMLTWAGIRAEAMLRA